MRSEPRSARTTVWPLSRSLAATYEIDVSFSSSPYLDVSVQAVPFHTLWIGVWMTGVLPAGFPHSDICGSRIICISPQLFAAYHVFLRLLVPRHPPCALVCFITCLQSSIEDLATFAKQMLSFLDYYHFKELFGFRCLDQISFILIIFFCMKFSRYNSFSTDIFTSHRKSQSFVLKSPIAGKFLFYSGSHLLSHTVTSIVSSAA